jgi:hypothetical protein
MGDMPNVNTALLVLIEGNLKDVAIDGGQLTWVLMHRLWLSLGYVILNSVYLAAKGLAIDGTS